MQPGILIAYIVPAILAGMMFGIGMTLTTADFKRIVIYPKAVMLGLFGQIIVLPVLAATIAIGFSVHPAIAVGLVLVASCPGGAMSNLYSHLARGDTALSVTLTTCSTFITVLTIPLYTSLALDYFVTSGEVIRLSFVESTARIVAVTILPVSLGMLVRARAPGFAERARRPFNIITTVFIAVAVVAAILRERHHLLDLIATSGLFVLLLYTTSILAGYLLARVGRLGLAQRKCIAIEVGFQNSVLAIVLATSMLNSPEIAVTPAVYSLFSVILTSLLVIPLNRWTEEAQRSAG